MNIVLRLKPIFLSVFMAALLAGSAFGMEPVVQLPVDGDSADACPLCLENRNDNDMVTTCRTFVDKAGFVKTFETPHKFCRQCLSLWIRDYGSTSCPTCRETFSSDVIFAVFFIMSGMSLNAQLNHDLRRLAICFIQLCCVIISGFASIGMLLYGCGMLTALTIPGPSYSLETILASDYLFCDYPYECSYGCGLACAKGRLIKFLVCTLIAVVTYHVAFAPHPDREMMLRGRHAFSILKQMASAQDGNWVARTKHLMDRLKYGLGQLRLGMVPHAEAH